MTIEAHNSPVSQRVAQILEQQGLKQCAVAKRAGLSVNQLNAILNGRRLIKVSEIPLLAKALDVQPSDLFAN